MTYVAAIQRQGSVNLVVCNVRDTATGLETVIFENR